MLPAYRDHTFVPSGTPFHFTKPPPVDVGSWANLSSDDPDAVVCAALARAQAGELLQTRHLVRLMRQNDLAWVWSNCAALLAHAAPRVVLDEWLETFLREITASDGATIEWIIEVLAETTEVRTIPAIIDLHRRMTPADRLHYCGAVKRLSFMLEPEKGEVFAGPADLLLNPDHEVWEDDEWSLDFSPYEAMLLERARELETRLSPGASATFRNEPLSLPKLAEFALAKVRRNKDSEMLATIRMLLEAYTGRDMRGFYRLEDYKLDPLAAAAMLEDMLESGELERFEPGVRYFFGHRID